MRCEPGSTYGGTYNKKSGSSSFGDPLVPYPHHVLVRSTKTLAWSKRNRRSGQRPASDGYAADCNNVIDCFGASCVTCVSNVLVWYRSSDTVYRQYQQYYTACNNRQTFDVLKEPQGRCSGWSYCHYPFFDVPPMSRITRLDCFRQERHGLTIATVQAIMSNRSI